MHPASNHFEGDFDAWVRHVFDHPAPASPDPMVDLPWYLTDIHADKREPDDITVAHYLTKMFRRPLESLAAYDDAQIAQGLYYLIHGSMYSLVNGSAPPAERVEAIAAIADLFRYLFAVRCTESLGHLDEQVDRPLNALCYIWWDTFGHWGRPDNPEQAAMDAATLDVLRRMLEIDHVGVQESALHGLGHWHDSYPETVECTIDEFLARPRARPFRPELVEYAMDAREGYVQ